MTCLSSKRISEVPICVLDFETTGLQAEGDRVIEVSAIRLRPDGSVESEFETLVNPRRRVAATEIHGITDADVKGAPTFRQIAPVLEEHMAGAVIAAYNVYFDLKFLIHEFGRLGIEINHPHLCLMYMRPLLGIGKRCPLIDACQELKVPYRANHIAYDDAIASAKLWPVYLEEIQRKRIETFNDLRGSKKYKFLQSFDLSLPATVSTNGNKTLKVKSRRNGSIKVPPKGHIPNASLRYEKVEAIKPNPDLPDYWEALQVAFSDYVITWKERRALKKRRKKLGLSEHQIRWVHSKIFHGIISDFGKDGKIDDDERQVLSAVYKDLKKLGYAPGQPKKEEIPLKGKVIIGGLILILMISILAKA